MLSVRWWGGERRGGGKLVGRRGRGQRGEWREGVQVEVTIRLLSGRSSTGGLQSNQESQARQTRLRGDEHELDSAPDASHSRPAERHSTATAQRKSRTTCFATDANSAHASCGWGETRRAAAPRRTRTSWLSTSCAAASTVGTVRQQGGRQSKGGENREKRVSDQRKRNESVEWKANALSSTSPHLSIWLCTSTCAA